MGWGVGRTSGLFSPIRAIPFGLVSIHAYFKMRADAIVESRIHFRPRQTWVSGMGRFGSYIYADDCMLSECLVLGRLRTCASFWGVGI